jgi:hypothetical protein
MSPDSSSSASSPPLHARRAPEPAARARPTALLSQVDVMALIIGVVIGAGIFSAPALVAMNVASMEHALIAWGVGGLIAIAGALCYAELATTYPSAGGEYHYLRMAFGEKVGFLFAWARLTVIPTVRVVMNRVHPSLRRIGQKSSRNVFVMTDGKSYAGSAAAANPAQRQPHSEFDYLF